MQMLVIVMKSHQELKIRHGRQHHPAEYELQIGAKMCVHVCRMNVRRKTEGFVIFYFIFCSL